MSNDHDILELLPAYALGSLTTEETARVEEHLPRCRECREELASWREVTGSLAFGVEQRTPSAGLEARVMARLSARRRPRMIPAVLQFRHPVLAAVASVLIVVLAAGNIAFWVRQSQPRTSVSSSLITVFLTGTSDARDAYGTIVIDRDDNHGIMAVRGLQPLDPSRTYQLWLVRGGERRSGGVFSVNPDGYGSLQVSVPVDFRGFTGFGISIEPAPGSPTPTGLRVMKGSI
jgi:anti-sigma-K factor RskA